MTDPRTAAPTPSSIPGPTTAPPTATEFDLRLAKVRAAMAAAGIDHYVCAHPDNVYYLTNFANYVHERPFILIVGMDGPLRFLVPKLEIPHVESRAVGTVELIDYPEFPAPAGRAWDDRLRSVLPAAARVGVESTCPLMVYEALPGSRLRVDIVDDARMVKTAYEIARIVHACQVVTEAHDRLLAEAVPGRSYGDIARTYGAMMRERIGREMPALNPLATKLNVLVQPPTVSHDPHNFTNLDMTLAAGGPNVSIINAVINGYGAEVERTFFLGTLPEAARAPYDAMMAAREAALAAIAPGVSMAAVDRAANAVFETAGYAGNLLHRAGHGLGVTGHEAPFFADGYERPIEPGMVFTMEPGVYLPGIGGFRHSDSILTTEDGYVMLTDGPLTPEAVTLPV